jgi:hypothetical protein
MMTQVKDQKMGFKETYEKFLYLEDELDLFDIKIVGVYFWERMRLELFYHILERSGVSGQHYTEKKGRFNRLVKTGILSIGNFLLKNPYLTTKKEVLFFGHQRRKLDEDGKWEDLYCDPIIENLNYSYVLIEAYNINTHLKPVKTKNIRYLDFIVFLSFMRRLLRIDRISFSEEESKMLLNIQKEIESVFKIKIDLLKLCKDRLLKRKSYLWLFKRLLKRIKPRIVILVVSYSPIAEILCEVCKTLMIPTVELQHGVISRFHNGYSYPGPKRKKRVFVDYFFGFGDFWKNSIEFPISKERIFSLGFPYLEKEIKRNLGVTKKRQILFISAGDIGIPLSKFAFELSNRDQHNYTIVYKLHPGEYNQWKRNYPWLVKSNIKVVDNDYISLYQFLAESEVQIGVASTVIYEGLKHGLRTFLVSLPGIEYMEYLIKEGIVEVVISVDEFLEALSKINKNKQIKGELFFRNNSLDNIHTKIDELIQ